MEEEAFQVRPEDQVASHHHVDHLLEEEDSHLVVGAWEDRRRPGAFQDNRRQDLEASNLRVVQVVQDHHPLVEGFLGRLHPARVVSSHRVDQVVRDHHLEV